MHGPPLNQKIELPGINSVIVVASGKGGVGKSTVAANLALGLAARGAKVGLMDADIYGPSVPIMMGLGTVDPQTTTFPMEKYGIKLMSMGFLVDPNQPTIWRGPMVHKAVSDFLTKVNWGELDYLVIDLPPGTGDAQLTLTQTAPLTGAVIVTTPQDVALIDARKGLEMFRAVRVPVLGIIENMSYFAPDAKSKHYLFGQGGGRKMAEQAGVPFLGEVPIDPRVTECGDLGEPIVHRHKDSPVAQAFLRLADHVAEQAIAAQDVQKLPEVEL
ncbi:MAG: Mrp/NBP35 family ATP-binding protein [Gemmataceae bacterium]